MFGGVKKHWNSLDNYTKGSILLILAGIILRFYLAFHASVAGDSCWHLGVTRFIYENWRIPLFENLGRIVFWAPPLFHVLNTILYSFISLITSS